MTPHLIGKRDCTERSGLTITRRCVCVCVGGDTHMHFQSKIGHVPVRAIRRETIKSGSFSRRDAAPVLLSRPKNPARGKISASFLRQRRRKNQKILPLARGRSVPVCPRLPSEARPLMALLTGGINAHTNTADARHWCVRAILCQLIG